MSTFFEWLAIVEFLRHCHREVAEDWLEQSICQLGTDWNSPSVSWEIDWNSPSVIWSESEIIILILISLNDCVSLYEDIICT